MRYISVCSGIEAATVAWHPLGWKPAAFSEIEAFPRAVLAHHYPEVPNWGDMTKFAEWPDADVDVLVGGTPCQSFSVAGLRKGMADPRGNPALTFLAIAAKYAPRWILWENVPGVLSSDGGRDFGSFLGGLGQCGYGWAYRVLDAQYFGVPQRRRRVFVVGYLGDWRRAAAVLFEHHSLSGHPAPRREKGQGIANAITERPDRGGGNSEGQRLIASTGETSHCLNAGGMGRQDYETETPIAIQAAATRENPDAGPQGAGFRTDGQAYTLEARAEVQAVAFDTTQITSAANYSNPKAGDPCHPLASGDHPPAVAFNARQDPSHGAVADALGTKDTGHGVMTSSAVRRLTPRECERLQGFPDDYTAVPYRGKLAADGPRYKALGNSMAVPVMRWIGERISMVEALQVERLAA